MDIIAETIEKSWYKFDPFLTTVCFQVLKKLEEYQIPKGEKGFNKCWLFQQLLYMISKDFEKKGKKLYLSYGWFRDGVVVDPESIMLQTRGKIKFVWEDDCPNCQIEEECPCKDNPWNDYYKLVEDKIALM
jgi:hypothetical protein